MNVTPGTVHTPPPRYENRRTLVTSWITWATCLPWAWIPDAYEEQALPWRFDTLSVSVRQTCAFFSAFRLLRTDDILSLQKPLQQMAMRFASLSDRRPFAPKLLSETRTALQFVFLLALSPSVIDTAVSLFTIALDISGWSLAYPHLKLESLLVHHLSCISATAKPAD